MAPGAVPVTGNRLGVERGHHAKILADAVEDEACRPEMIAHADALARSDLKLPLGTHEKKIPIKKGLTIIFSRQGQNLRALVT